MVSSTWHRAILLSWGRLTVPLGASLQDRYPADLLRGVRTLSIRCELTKEMYPPLDLPGWAEIDDEVDDYEKDIPHGIPNPALAFSPRFLDLISSSTVLRTLALINREILGPSKIDVAVARAQMNSGMFGMPVAHAMGPMGGLFTPETILTIVLPMVLSPENCFKGVTGLYCMPKRWATEFDREEWMDSPFGQSGMMEVIPKAGTSETTEEICQHMRRIFPNVSTVFGKAVSDGIVSSPSPPWGRQLTYLHIALEDLTRDGWRDVGRAFPNLERLIVESAYIGPSTNNLMGPLFEGLEHPRRQLPILCLNVYVRRVNASLDLSQALGTVSNVDHVGLMMKVCVEEYQSPHRLQRFGRGNQPPLLYVPESITGAEGMIGSNVRSVVIDCRYEKGRNMHDIPWDNFPAFLAAGLKANVCVQGATPSPFDGNLLQIEETAQRIAREILHAKGSVFFYSGYIVRFDVPGGVKTFLAMDESHEHLFYQIGSVMSESPEVQIDGLLEYAGTSCLTEEGVPCYEVGLLSFVRDIHFNHSSRILVHLLLVPSLKKLTIFQRRASGSTERTFVDSDAMENWNSPTQQVLFDLFEEAGFELQAELSTEEKKQAASDLSNLRLLNEADEKPRNRIDPDVESSNVILAFEKTSDGNVSDVSMLSFLLRTMVKIKDRCGNLIKGNHLEEARTRLAFLASSIDFVTDQYDSAIASATTALLQKHLLPTQIATLSNLLLVLMKLNDLDNAFRIAEALMGFVEDMTSAQKVKTFFRLGYLFEMKGEAQKAEREYLVALEFDPGNRAVLSRLQRLQMRRNCEQ